MPFPAAMQLQAGTALCVSQVVPAAQQCCRPADRFDHPQRLQIPAWDILIKSGKFGPCQKKRNTGVLRFTVPTLCTTVDYLSVVICRYISIQIRYKNGTLRCYHSKLETPVIAARLALAWQALRRSPHQQPRVNWEGKVLI